MQPGEAVRRQPQHRQRQAFHHGPFLPGWQDDAVPPGSRQCRRDVHHVRDHGAGGDATTAEPGGDARKQRRLAAEQPGAAGDVQNQAVRRVGRGEGRETQGPERQALQ